MSEMPSLSVREIELPDVELIADYWLESDPDFMVSLGVDLEKLPRREDLTKMLSHQLSQPNSEKQSYALIWELNGEPVGHSNVNNICFGKEATMHLHLWQSVNRQKGLGAEFVKMSVPYFFENLKLKRIIVEPYALNPAPNDTLLKVGFKYLKTHSTIPGSLNFMQEVNRYELTLINARSLLDW